MIMDVDRLERLRYRYSPLIEIDYKIIEDINTATFLSLCDVVERLNKQDRKIRELEKSDTINDLETKILKIKEALGYLDNQEITTLADVEGTLDRIDKIVNNKYEW